MLIPKVEERIAQYLNRLEGMKYRVVANLRLEVMEAADTYRKPPEEGSWEEIKLPYPYGREWTYYWFRSRFELPQSVEGHEVFLRLEPHADSLVFLDGKPVGAVNPYHDILRVTSRASKGESYVLALEAYAGHKYPGIHPLMAESVIVTLGVHLADYPNRFERAEVVVKNEAIYALYYDVRVLLEAARQLPENSLRRNRILRGLYDALSTMPLSNEPERIESSAGRAASAVATLLTAKNGDTTPEIYLVGHAHIDHAWLWPIAETEHKAARTFANMVRYAEEFEEFVFVQSQPAQLDVVRREYPEIFSSVVAAFERGQWEPNGGMWVEADCNLTGGEALIRQFLVGKRATREMLGYEGDTLWLPDVFGYAAALPQILTGCEIEYFVTSKINWNDTTRFPYDTFLWKGIDGTPVKTHFITSRIDGYNGKVDPASLADAWNQVQHKEIQSAVVKPIGEGDGGGGTRRCDLEFARRLANLEGTPKTEWLTVTRALGQIFAAAEELPQWQGELYLELHRGTYTTQARTKRYNRKLEFALRECEWLYSLPAILGNGYASNALRYPHEELLDCWKKLLTNQFHDIIPGSSIGRVYEDAEASYREIEKTLEGLNERARKALAAQLCVGRSAPGGESPSVKSSAEKEEIRAVAIFNSLSWERRSLVALPILESGVSSLEIVAGEDRSPVQIGRSIDDRQAAFSAPTIPAMGVAAYRVARTAAPESPFRGDESGVESPYYRISFDEHGRISSLVDKEDGREFVRPGDALNRFQSADDLPVKWDAWDIEADWMNSVVDEDRLDSSEVVSDGPLFFQIRRSYSIGEHSHLVQDTIVYSFDRRIDFVTKVDWHESHRLLKAAFPVNLTANQARCEVQYGHVVRNTHSNLPGDRAQFEVSAHKWVCVEEQGHGAAVLNDCKYGCDLRGSAMRLTLLRSPKAPDPVADMGTHYFTYSLLPYRENFVDAGVVRAAYDLNCPLTAVEASVSGEASQPAFSALTVSNDNVVVESIKAPEEPMQGRGRELIIRLYESAGAAQIVALSLSTDISSVEETNMLERAPRPLRHEERTVELRFRPFEIKTLRVLCAT